jgi:hypothetical protein
MDLTGKQKELYRLISANRIVLAEGGARSGKTIGLVNNIFLRAVKYPNTDYLIVRHRFNHVKLSIGMQTIPKLEQINKVPYSAWLDRTNNVYSVPNGSRVWLDGLDDKQRAEKALGREYSVIYFNEASEIGYNEFELLQTRLNPPKGLKPHIFIDYNPPSITHWGYQIFRKRVFPDGSPVSADDYAFIQMNPRDNPHVSDTFIKTLEGLSAAKRKRFLEGEYATDSGALWKRDWIKYGQADKYIRIVVAVDPTGSVQGDECGIVVSARGGGNYYALEDYSLHGTPKEWAAEACAAYDRWKADVVIAEKNFGGDMVAETIRHVKPNINVKLIWSSRGKLVRAEPISALYEQGKVFHAKKLPELEDEMCLYDGNGDSPNRLDALVFGLSELSEGTRSSSVGASRLLGV